MLLTAQPLRNLFSDGSSLILRALLREPNRHWTVTDLAQEGVTAMMASKVLSKAESLGYVRRHRAGRNSYSRLTDGSRLLRDWRSSYRFDDNKQVEFFYGGGELEDALRKACHEFGIHYAWTLFSASRLIAPYVRESRDCVYLDIETPDAQRVLDRIRVRLALTPMNQGGNLTIALPFYRRSVFRNVRMIENRPVVSPLQLYLDLYGHSAPGRQEAEFLARSLPAREHTWLKFLT